MGEPIQILEGDGPRLNPLHISDAVEATERALAIEADEVLNVAGTEVTTFAEIAALAARRAGREALIERIPRAEAIPYYRSDLVASIARMQDRLGFTPRVSLEATIFELADHYLHSPG
jgi:nucleoside-diphosphate-sugar epimerase